MAAAAAGTDELMLWRASAMCCCCCHGCCQLLQHHLALGGNTHEQGPSTERSLVMFALCSSLIVYCVYTFVNKMFKWKNRCHKRGFKQVVSHTLILGVSGVHKYLYLYTQKHQNKVYWFEEKSKRNTVGQKREETGTYCVLKSQLVQEVLLAGSMSGVTWSLIWGSISPSCSLRAIHKMKVNSV